MLELFSTVILIICFGSASLLFLIIFFIAYYISMKWAVGAYED